MSYTIRLEVALPVEAIEDIIDGAGDVIGYWSSAGVVDTEAETYTVTDGEDDKEYVIRYADIARAIQLLVDGDVSIRSDIREAITLDLIDYDNAHRMDGECYDAIIQVASLGEITYG